MDWLALARWTGYLAARLLALLLAALAKDSSE